MPRFEPPVRRPPLFSADSAASAASSASAASAASNVSAVIVVIVVIVVIAAGTLQPIAGFAQSAESGPLDEIVVTASRVATPLRQVGAAVSVLSGADIELRSYASMADVLRTQPGIAVSNSGGIGRNTTLRIRGEEGYRTLALIDGVKVADPTAPQPGPSFDHLLATGDVARVEVLRGPQGFIYGADAGGIVNILTRSGEGPAGGGLAAELGAFGTRKLDANVSGGGPRGDYFVSATRLEADGFNAQSADTVLADDDGYENTTVHAKLGWNASEALRLQLVAHDVDARDDFDGCGFPTVHDCVGGSEQTTYRLSAVLDTGKLENTFAYSNLDVATRSLAAGLVAFSTDGGLSRAEYTGSYRPMESAAFVYGLDFQREAIRGTAAARERLQRAYYFEYQGRIDDRFFFSAGGRYDDNADFGGHTSARLSAAYVQPLASGAAIKYRTSVGTGFRAPSLYELAYNRGPFAFPPAAGLDLTEESTAGFDVGIDFTGPGGTTAEATYFDQRIEDEIYFDAAGYSGYLQSPGRSRSHGVELALSVPIARSWNFLGNFTYDRTEDQAGRPRIRRPKQLGNLGFRFLPEAGKLKLMANYRFSRDAVDEVFGVGRVPLDDYAVLDVSGAYALSPLLEIYGRIENLTDQDYEEVIGFNTPGRSAWAGVRLRF